MALARQAANVAKGWRQSVVDEAAKQAAELLIDRVQPCASALFDEHRAAGRLLVLATTTPYDLVKPLADLLGFDDVVATRYGVADDGTYDGTIVGDVRVGERQARRGARVGRRARRRPGEQLVLLRQLLRHAVAVGGRASGRREPRPSPELCRLGAPVAYAAPRRARRCPQVPSASSRNSSRWRSRGPSWSRTRASTSPASSTSRSGARRSSSRNHRSYFDVTAMAMLARQGGPHGALPRQEGGVRRPGRRSAGRRPSAASASSGAPGPTSRWRPRPPLSTPASWWRSCRRAPSPAGPAFFDPVLKGRWGAARLAAA